MKVSRIILSVIMLIYSIPTVLSLLDIHKGTEPDLSEEWIIVGVYMILNIFFVVVTLAEFIRRDKKIPGEI